MHSAALDWITSDAEKVIARHARVSTKNPDRDEYAKLLRYCMIHGHWSVFEQAAASFEIITSRDISAQIIRHRSFSFQELSQRYSNPFEILPGVCAQSWDFQLRAQAEKNRQSSAEPLSEAEDRKFKERLWSFNLLAQSLYYDMVSAGVARECARKVLPLYTPTKIHMQGTIRSFVHYVGLRGQEDTQLEHRLIAHQIGAILAKELPTLASALKEVDRPELSGWSTIL